MAPWFWKKDVRLAVPYFQHTPYEIVTRNTGAFVGAREWRLKQHGLAAHFDASNNYHDFDDIDAADTISLVAFFNKMASGADRLVAVANNTSTQRFVLLQTNGTDNPNFQFRANASAGADASLLTGSSTLSAGEDYMMIGQTIGGVGSEIFLNGVSDGTNSVHPAASNLNPVNRTTIGSLQRSSPLYSTDLNVYWAAVLYDSFTAEEALELYRDPFGPFRQAEEPRTTSFVPSAGGQTVNVGLASETDTAFSVNPDPQKVNVAVGLATETDTAFSVTPSTGLQTVAVGLATETDTAFAVTASPGTATVAVGLASETDTAFDVSVVATATIAVGLASETDTAFSITVAPGTATVALGLATETDTALSVTNPVDEADIVRVLNVTSDIRVLDVATEVRVLNN